jgi:hypothetical protein
MRPIDKIISALHFGVMLLRTHSVKIDVGVNVDVKVDQPPPPAGDSAAPMTMAEVAAVLDSAAKMSGERLDWRHSVVDLMKLLPIDSGLNARCDLARELGYTGALNGSAAMNIWLHEKVMQQIAEHVVAPRAG